MSRSAAVNFWLSPALILERDDGFAADTLNFSAAKTNVLEFLDPFEIRGNDLKLQARASGVHHEDIHRQHSLTGYGPR